MAKDEFEFYWAGLRFFLKQCPCVIMFERDGEIMDIVLFDDVQNASEYLVKCRYQCSDKIVSEWTRGSAEVARILYIEDRSEECIKELLKEIRDGKEKDR